MGNRFGGSRVGARGFPGMTDQPVAGRSSAGGTPPRPGAIAGDAGEGSRLHRPCRSCVFPAHMASQRAIAGQVFTDARGCPRMSKPFKPFKPFKFSVAFKGFKFSGRFPQGPAGRVVPTRRREGRPGGRGFSRGRGARRGSGRHPGRRHRPGRPVAVRGDGGRAGVTGATGHPRFRVSAPAARPPVPPRPHAAAAARREPGRSGPAGWPPRTDGPTGGGGTGRPVRGEGVSRSRVWRPPRRRGRCRCRRGTGRRVRRTARDRGG